MNSCLQCLSNTQSLTQYFLKELYEKEINKVNPLGTKGKLAKNYAKFIKGMWCDSEGTFSPYNLKAAVSSIAPIFSGYAQNDSQEFLTFIVDGLHEDLNRIEKKPYVETMENEDADEKELALDAWLNHSRRNQSIIVDTMTGQYKSKVICPDCGKNSTTFDPFTTITLPIPYECISTVECFIIHPNFEEETKRVNISYKKATNEELLRKGAEKTGVNEKYLRYMILTMYEGIYKLPEVPAAELISKVENEKKNLFLMMLTKEEAAI